MADENLVSQALDLVVSAFNDASLQQEEEEDEIGKSKIEKSITAAFTAFEEAISKERGHVRRLKAALMNMDLRSYKLHKIIDCQGRNLLHWAAANGDLDTVIFLVRDKQMSVHIKDDHGCIPLIHALYSNNSKVIHYLIERGSNLNDSYVNILVPAIERGDVTQLEYLLNKKADIDALQPLTALQYASRVGNPIMVKALLNKNAKVNNGLPGTQKPIMEALSNIAISSDSSLSCINTLFVKEAVKGDEGVFGFDISPLCYLASMEPFERKVEIIQAFLRNKADPTRADSLGLTPLEGAAVVRDFTSAVYLAKQNHVFPGVDEWSLKVVMDHVAKRSEERSIVKSEVIKKIVDNGNICLSNKEYYGAMAWYTLARKISGSKDAHVISCVSFCCAKLQLKEHARMTANECVSAFPLCPTGYIRLAEACRLQHYFNEADATITKGLEILPNNPELLEALRYTEKNDEQEWLFLPNCSRFSALVTKWRKMMG